MTPHQQAQAINELLYALRKTMRAEHHPLSARVDVMWRDSNALVDDLAPDFRDRATLFDWNKLEDMSNG